jgi:glycosyltransferase involved in cell wall biosynthesis
MTSHDGRSRIAVLPRIEGEPYLRSVFNDNDQYVGLSATKTVLRTGSFDILHVQWPESFLMGDLRRRTSSAGRLALAMATARRHSKPLVVTIHNLIPHDSKLTILNRRLVRYQLKSADAVIVLSYGGADRALRAFPELIGQRVEVIPHPNWASEYAPPTNWAEIRQKTRRDLGVSENAVLFSMLGAVRPYKGVPEVVQRWCEFDIAGDSHLLIAGRFDSSEYEKLPALHRASRVIIKDRRLKEAEYRALLLATDVAVFNFTDIENSGSFIAALAAGCRTLAPDVGALREYSLLTPDAHLRCTWFRDHLSINSLGEQVLLGTSDRSSSAIRPVTALNNSRSVIDQHGDLYRTLSPRVAGR